MRNTVKLILILFVSSQYSNAINAVDWGFGHYPSQCSLSQYTGKETKCVKLVYQEINERLDRVYSQLLKTLPKDNATQLTKEYKSWQNDKNRSCSKHSNNEIKLKACYIDKTIPKINELWRLDNEVNKGQFEGKWTECFESDDGGENICVADFFIQQDDNICGTVQGFECKYRFLLRSKDGIDAKSVKVCQDGYFCDYTYCKEYTDADNFKDIDISEWSTSDDESIGSGEVILGDFFGTSIKTPILPDVTEDLIKNNKWLRDCLNYKGE